MSISLILRPGRWLLGGLRLTQQLVVVVAIALFGMIALALVATARTEPFWIWSVVPLISILMVYVSVAMASEMSIGIAALTSTLGRATRGDLRAPQACKAKASSHTSLKCSTEWCRSSQPWRQM